MNLHCTHLHWTEDSPGKVYKSRTQTSTGDVRNRNHLFELHSLSTFVFVAVAEYLMRHDASARRTYPTKRPRFVRHWGLGTRKKMQQFSVHRSSLHYRRRQIWWYILQHCLPASGVRDANAYKARSLLSTQPGHVRLESEFSSSSCSPDLESSH